MRPTFMLTTESHATNRGGTRPRRRCFLIVAAMVSMLLFGLVVLRGPKVEYYYQCQLTGRDRIVISYAGFTTSDRTSTNEVSLWAEANSVTNLIAAQCGWTQISTVTTYWFSPPRFGESMTHMIPRRIHQDPFNLPGKTREETLRAYQTAIVTAFNAGKSIWQVQQQFVESVGP